jgi:hypothetical protein
VRFTNVVDLYGTKIFGATTEEVERMLKEHQVRRTGNPHIVQIIGCIPEKVHPCRTRTGQRYTYSERGRVSGHKKIFPEDLNVFRAATLDCMRPHWVGGSMLMSITITTVSGKTHRVFFDEGLVKSS